MCWTRSWAPELEQENNNQNDIEGRVLPLQTLIRIMITWWCFHGGNKDPNNFNFNNNICKNCNTARSKVPSTELLTCSMKNRWRAAWVSHWRTRLKLQQLHLCVGQSFFGAHGLPSTKALRRNRWNRLTKRFSIFSCQDLLRTLVLQQQREINNCLRIIPKLCLGSRGTYGNHVMETSVLASTRARQVISPSPHP